MEKVFKEIMEFQTRDKLQGDEFVQVSSSEIVNLKDQFTKLEKQLHGNFFTEIGKYIDSNGRVYTASTSSVVTDFLDLNDVEFIKIKGRSGSSVSLLAYYDENKEFISSIYGSAYSDVLITLTKDEFPANARYFRATGKNDGNDVLLFDNFLRVEREIQDFSNNFKEQLESNFHDIQQFHGNFFTEIGKYIDSNGRVYTASTSSVVTDFLDLNDVEFIKIKGRSGSSVSLLAYYDENKTFISNLYGSNYNNVLVELTKEDFPSNARYFRATGKNDGNDVLLFDNFLRVERQLKSNVGLRGIATMGASLMYSGNGWVEQGCSIIGATPYNKAVSGELPPYFANKLYNETYCTDEEFENTDVLVIQFSNIGNAYIEENTLSIEDYESMINTDLENPFGALSNAQCLDYILKKWQKKCYLQKDNADSRWYGTQFGKPCNLLFVTHWHNARKSYNDSIRQVAEKWGGGVCEFDKRIGFSKYQPLYNGTQMSVIYAVDTEVIGNVEYGWHPLRGKSGQMYIQKKMANIFAQCLIELNSMK